MNPQTCTKLWFAASHLVDFQTFELLTPYKPPPPNTPWDIEGLIVFSLCPFPYESAGAYQIWCQSVQPFGRLSRCLNCWPPKTPQMPPWYLEQLIVFSYSIFLNFWHPKTPQTPCALELICFFSQCPFPDMCAKFGANRPFPPMLAICRNCQKLRYWVGFVGVLSVNAGERRSPSEISNPAFRVCIDWCLIVFTGKIRCCVFRICAFQYCILFHVITASYLLGREQKVSV